MSMNEKEMVSNLRAEQILRLVESYDAGQITEEEFQRQKKALLENVDKSDGATLNASPIPSAPVSKNGKKQTSIGKSRKLNTKEAARRFALMNEIVKEHEEYDEATSADKIGKIFYVIFIVIAGIVFGVGRFAFLHGEKEKSVRKASEQAVAQFMKDYKGVDVEEDKAEAGNRFRKAAERGHAAAQNNLGYMYQNGYGVEEDKAEAVKWYRKAAERGNASAQNNLGYMYENGEGVKEDKMEAVNWYRKAAEQGYAAAQFHLGYMYAQGEGISKDKSEAVKWLRKAAHGGEKRAIEFFDKLKESGELNEE